MGEKQNGKRKNGTETFKPGTSRECSICTFIIVIIKHKMVNYLLWDGTFVFYCREVVKAVINVILVSLQDFGILVCVAFGIKI